MLQFLFQNTDDNHLIDTKELIQVLNKEYRSMSTMQLKELFKADLPDDEKILIDVKSLYRMDELKASEMRFWKM